MGKALGLELDEVKNWNCCGAMEVKNIDPKLQTYLSSRVMSIAANEMGAKVVMAPCNGCYHNLKKAEHDLAHDEGSREVTERLSRKAGHETYRAGQIETIHALDWIKHGIGEDELKRRVRNSLKGLKVANYYGCMYTRPRHIFPEKDQGPGSESTSKPHFMDDLLAAAGAENVEFPLKTACCGGAHTLSDSDISTKLVLNILRAAEAAGADVIATECPTCHSGLEMHQVRAEKVLGQKTTVKMLYFTQLLGLALGLSPRKVGVHENVSDSLDLLEGEAARMRSRCRRRSRARCVRRLRGWAAGRALAARAWPRKCSSSGSSRVARRRRTSAAKGFACSRCIARVRGASRASTPAARPAARSRITTTCCACSPIAELDARRQRMMAMLAKHLTLFVGGKMQSGNLGEFCCSSRALRSASS